MSYQRLQQYIFILLDVKINFLIYTFFFNFKEYFYKNHFLSFLKNVYFF